MGVFPNRANRFKITVDKTKVPSSQTSFVVYFPLANAPSEFWDVVNSDGGDLIVTSSDGTTRLSLEVADIVVGSQDGEIHFKAFLSSLVDPDFYIYYGNTSASQPARDEAYGLEDVWSNDFIAVYHMTQDPSGSAPQMLDSTHRQNHGTSNGSMTGGDIIEGIVGKALVFDGIDDRIVIPDHADFDFGTGEFSISFWFKTDTENPDMLYIYRRDGNDHRIETYINFPTVGKYGADFFNAPNELRLTSTEDTAGSDTWHHVCLACDIGAADGMKMYIDGVESTSGTFNYALSDWNNITLGDNGVGGFYYTGAMDEAKTSGVKRSEDWNLTEYNNQKSPGTFFTVGDEEVLIVEKTTSYLL